MLIGGLGSENTISYIDKNTASKQIVETLDFKIFSLQEIKKYIDMSGENLYLLMKEFDNFIENGVLDLNTWLKDNIDENELKAKLLEERI